MLQDLDFSKRMEEEEYEGIIEDRRNRLGALQRRSRDEKVPIVLVFEGVSAAELGIIVNRVLSPLDPRGFDYHYMADPTIREKDYPLMWRFWAQTPSRGRIALFDRSWYSRHIFEEFEEKRREKVIEHAVLHSNGFESTLAADGFVIIKFFMHMSKKECKRRREEQTGKKERCAFLRTDNHIERNYEKCMPIFDEVLKATDRPYAPWIVVKAEDRRYATIKVMDSLIDILTGKLDGRNDSPPSAPRNGTSSADHQAVKARHSLELGECVLQPEYKDKLAKHQERLAELQCGLYERKVPTTVILEGWDAAGKGGAIQRLTAKLNPRAYQVIPIGPPTEAERERHYLWRFIKNMPPKGHLAIFDRSWYGRVLVERVEGLATENEWRRAFQEINELEEMILDGKGILVKIWLEVSKEEQLKRFKEREGDPNKVWKIGEEDWRNREKWSLYEKAIDDMLALTSTEKAPWTLVPSNDKYNSRLHVMKAVIEAAEKALN